jgi:hypothetical protein
VTFYSTFGKMCEEKKVPFCLNNLERKPSFLTYFHYFGSPISSEDRPDR